MWDKDILCKCNIKIEKLLTNTEYEELFPHTINMQAAFNARLFSNGHYRLDILYPKQCQLLVPHPLLKQWYL